MSGHQLLDIAVQRTPLQRKDQGRVGQVFFEFNLPSNTPDTFSLIFQNYYVSTLILIQEFHPITEPIRLMKSAYNEAEAQNNHCIHSSSFIGKVNKSKPIRALLFQPSSLWTKLDIRDLKISFVKDEGAAKFLFPSTHVTLTSLILEDTDLLTKAAKIQSHMKFLPEIIYTNNNEVKRSSKRKEKKKDKKIQLDAT
jgi:hypothetical protein